MRLILFSILLSLSIPHSTFAASATAVNNTCYIFVAWGHQSVEEAVESVKRRCGYDCYITSTNPSHAAIAIASGAVPYGYRVTTPYNCVIGLSTTSSTFTDDAVREAINNCVYNRGQYCQAMWGPYY